MDKEYLKTALNGLEKDVLLDSFCLLYEEYKSGKDNGVLDTPMAASIEPDIPNFVSLVLYLKEKYKFEELKDFSIEGGRVIFKRGGRRIELSLDEEDVVMNTPSASPSVNSEEAAPRFRQLEMN